MRRLLLVALAAVAPFACARPAAAPGPLPPRAPVRPRQMPLPLPAKEVARLLEREPFVLREMEPATGGVTRVDRVDVHFARQRVTLEAKWKVAPAGGEAWNNVPRKEVAAFLIQQWFLDPADWLVPPTAVRCIPLAEHARFREAPAIVEDTRCVLGMIAAWLDDVVNPEQGWDPERFARDPAYARHRADLNLLGYLLDHRDGRMANFLVPEDDDGRVFLVDNGISFGGLVWNYFVDNWNVIRVPALRREPIERLRRIGDDELRALLVVAELRADEHGVLQPVPHGTPLDPDAGARLRPGHAQLGLTASEIDGLAHRLRTLLARIDAGDLPLF